MKGQVPIEATVYALEKLPCNLCGETFTAVAPEGGGEEKYDATMASMVALACYGKQISLESTGRRGGESGHSAAGRGTRRSAAQHDIPMPVLALRRDADADHNESDAAEGAGVFTSGIVSTPHQQDIALLAPAIQMCDAPSCNGPKRPERLEVIVGHCLTHARRRLVEVTPNFPESAGMFPLGLQETGKTITRRRDTSRWGNALSPRPSYAGRSALQRVGSSEAAIAFAEGRSGATC